MEKTPKVSIVMAVYNDEPFLKKALNSVLNQTYKNIEIVFIDDASTDHSLKIAKDLAEKDTRIKILTNKKNLRQARSLNKAFGAATGKYIALFDGDDELNPTRIEKQLNFMIKKDLDFSYCDMLMIYEDGKRELKESIDFKPDFKEKLKEASKKDFDMKMRPGFHLSPSKDPKKVKTVFGGGFMFKTNILKKVEFDEQLKRMADHDFWFQVIGANLKIARCPLPLYHYKMHPQQTSRNLDEGDVAAIYISKKLKSGAYFK